ncbi:MBL fold metallo-hydrolase [Pseudoalteromonas sp. JBTF-M23]|uniref:MBL fold metallo-hydrolase n=1 Tax=Pseudoalteromonas caenipelagi TaxID=2726988 RepID=A0A849VHG5_9GAMM|nr:MBL fold metallo-hydrolase [Pseudoalteromonas caenipelagi]NOU52148.1 MBL fold metallo-hydrolase [Pseudoalteromonas caenipelagi]
MFTKFQALVASTLLVLASASFGSVANEHKTVQKIADNTYSFSLDGGYISMFSITNNSVVVFETMNSHHAKSMLAAIREITDKPIKYALHSHNHWDHASGGKVFTDEGAITLAHQEAAQWMVANPYQDMTPPTETWQGQFKQLKVDELSIELHYLGMNHGLGMTVFYLPEQKLVYLADIVTPNRVIFSVVPDFNLREWERSLKALLKMDFNKAVFSHNEKEMPLLAGSKADVQAQLEYLQDLRKAFYAELQKGTNPMLIPSTLKLPKYQNWVGYDQWLAMNVWRVLADEFMGPFPWRPEPK